MAIVTKADLARELDVTPPRISQYIKAGMPVRSDGKLQRDDALQWLKLNQPGLNTREPGRDKPDKGADRAARLTGKATSGPLPGLGAPLDDLAEDPAHDLDDENLPLPEAIRRKENYLGLRRRQEFQRSRAELVERAAAEALFFEMARDIRDNLLAWPARIAVTAADELRVDAATGKVDARSFAMVMTAQVRQFLTELGEPEEPDWKPAR